MRMRERERENERDRENERESEGICSVCVMLNGGILMNQSSPAKRPVWSSLFGPEMGLPVVLGLQTGLLLCVCVCVCVQSSLFSAEKGLPGVCVCDRENGLPVCLGPQ